MAIIDKIKTVVLVMLENRSFDHMLGHLSLERINAQVDGFKDPLTNYANFFEGDRYNPFNFRNDSNLQFDLPHEWDFVATQLAQSSVTNVYSMSGFVEAYAKATGVNPNPQNDPMGFFKSSQVPITSFLANNFCTCERWFASLPTSTQPNRTMAFCGDSGIFSTGSGLIDIEDSIFDWMNRPGVNVKWRVYHDGLSFFVLYPHLWKYAIGSNFRDYEFLFRDMQREPANDDPQVIIVEPSYQDAPHIGPDHPNDNHAPLAIGWGEDFLRRTYQAITANPKRFGSTVMVVYYDEHGGFYDHVPPPAITYTTNGKHPHTFNSLGPRIPGIIISPFVTQGSVCQSLLDHTSVLQFLAEKFTPGSPYNATVENRRAQGISSISTALTNDIFWSPPEVSSALGDNISVAPSQPMGQSFELAAMELIHQQPSLVDEKYPELLQWKAAVDKARS